jgi:YidC/Oxa1 family membrane protein insertase
VNNDAWYSPVIDGLGTVLTWLHDLVEPAVGIHAWGWAIILLTLVVRILLLPLAIKQTRSMRAMQKLQPQMKELQKKYKVDRSLLKKDPEQYKAKKQKLNEEMMALYQREGANPAASCLPLLAQAPVFLALFWTLRWMEELRGAEFYFFTAVGEGGLEQIVRGAGWPGWLLILLMSGTMFISQKQMMNRNPMQAEGPMAQQQKVLLYAMPVFLAFISLNFPMGILLYWVTTNAWQVAQQWIILKEVQHEQASEAKAGGEATGTGSSATSGTGKGATSGKGTGSGKGTDSGKGGASKDKGDTSQGNGSKGAKGAKGPKGTKGSKGGATGSEGTNGSKPGKGKSTSGKGSGEGPNADASKPSSAGSKKRDHLPRRGGGRQG